VARYLPTYAGLLVESELSQIDSFLQKPKRPLVFVLGGAKLSTKIGLIKKLIGLADHVLVGGALATSFFAAAGVNVGKSVVDPESFEKARQALRAADRKPGHMILPHDLLAGKSPQEKKPHVVATEAIPKNEAVYDIGPETTELYNAIIAKAGTIIFNGAPGVFEKKPFATGTKRIFTAIARSTARTLAGGGETILALDEYKISERIDFISTGGGALLSYIEGAPMPGLKAIPNA
jgi:phosphoglycerate kinase